MDKNYAINLAVIAINSVVTMLKDGGAFSSWLGILKSTGGQVAELGGHFAQESLIVRFQKQIASRLLSPQKALQNHHLTNAVGESIKLVISEATKNPKFTTWKSDLKKIASKTPKAWADLAAGITAGGLPKIADLSEHKLIDLFAVSAAEQPTLTACDIPAWEGFLRSCCMNIDDPIALPSEVIKGVAELLHHKVPHALREFLKHDAEHGGATFAGLELMFFGELQALCLEMRNDHRALHELVAKTAGDAAARQTELVERLDALAKQISTQSETVFARLPEIVRHEFREEGLRRDKLIQHLWALKSNVLLPFRSVEDIGNFGKESEANAFRPSRSEYREGLVHRPALADLVEQSLMDYGYAMVEGYGASGKTVLALSIALGKRFLDHTAYYLDLTDFDEASANAVEKLQLLILTSDKVLFIVDNVHLNKRAAQDLFGAWQGNPSGSRLLLLVRHVELGPDIEGRQSLLGDLNPDAIYDLKVEAPDLVGAYKRLARREPGSADIPIPPLVRQQQWLNLFKGDLILFSAAVKVRLPDLLHKRWQLSTEDARQFVRDKYLYRQEVSENERKCLLTVAVFSRLELVTPEEMLDMPELRHSLNHGVVYRSVTGGRLVRYRLNHPHLGDLLLGAATEQIDERQVWLKLAQRSPFLGAHLARRLTLSGDKEFAILVLREALNQPSMLSECTKPNLQGLRFVCRLAAQLGLKDLFAAMVKKLDAGKVAEQAERTPLEHLASFLSYARTTEELKGLFAAVVAKLNQPEAIDVLARNTCVTPLPHVVHFLRDSPLAEAVIRAIDLAAWNTARSTARDERPDYVHGFFRAVNRLGRPELAEAPAAALLRCPKPADWHASGIGLQNLTQTLRSGRAAGIGTLRKFLNAIVTPDWLRDEYDNANPGGIAGALFAVRSLWVPEFLDHFLRELPPDLLSRSLTRLYTANTRESGQILSLLGFYDLVSLPIDVRGVRWPSAVRFEEAEDIEKMTAPVVLRWLGLRAMAKYRSSDRINVPPEIGNHILTLWRKAETHTPQAEALNRWMIVWLERCAASDWILLPDRTSLILPPCEVKD